MVQSEIGDYDVTEHGEGIDYLRNFAFVQGQTDDLLAKVGELHRTHRGIRLFVLSRSEELLPY